MTHLDLSQQEASLLKTILVRFPSELRRELADTGTHDLPQAFKNSEESIKAIIARLEWV